MNVRLKKNLGTMLALAGAVSLWAGVPAAQASAAEASSIVDATAANRDAETVYDRHAVTHQVRPAGPIRDLICSIYPPDLRKYCVDPAA